MILVWLVIAILLPWLSVNRTVSAVCKMFVRQ
jgi:hypothetical protein